MGNSGKSEGSRKNKAASLPLAKPAPWKPARRHRRINNWGDLLFQGLALFFALAIPALMALMILVMWGTAKAVFAHFGWRFFISQSWDPVRDVYGALPFIYGTVVSSFLALLIAGPVSLGVAIFLAEIAPSWLRVPVSFLVELLAAIPSVVYGLWGIFVLVPLVRTPLETWLSAHLGFLPLFRGTPQGVGMLAGGLILAIMITPTIAALSREVLLAVPQSQREAAYALGATRWEVIWTVVLDHARPGLLGAIILGLGRALGETMAVTMVIGNRPLISPSIFDAAATMASVIANEFAEASTDLHLGALVALGLILFCVTLLINALARFLVWRIGKRARLQVGG